MRSVTSAERTVLTGLDRQELRRVEVADSTGTLVDLTSGVDFVDDVRLSENVDQGIASASIGLFREVEGQSLAPLMNSPEPVAEGRRVVVSAAVIAQGADPVAADWQTMFDGFIDDTGWGGSNAELELVCRGKGGLLKDTWIESVGSYGSDADPVAIATVMQALLDDTLGGSSPTLTVSGTPDFGIVAYEQQIQSLWDALQTLAQLQGWDLRYRWSDASSDFVLTYSEPDRIASATSWTFGPQDYFDIPSFTRSTANVRNVCTVKWAEGSTVTVEDSASIAEFRRRLIYLDSASDPQIDDATKATNLANAVIGDTGRPIASQAVEMPFFWPVQLGDFLEFLGNDVHYNSAQKMAVTAITHTLSRDPRQPFNTVLHTRGQPSGSPSRWIKKEKDRRDRDGVTTTGIPTGPGTAVPAAPEGVESPTIGFTDSGQVIVSIGAQAAVVGIIATLAVDGASAATISTDATTFTTAAVASGASSVAVDAASGYAGYWCSISDGSAAEVVYCSSHGGNTFSIDGTFANSYTTKATVRRYVQRTTDDAGGIRARSGSFTSDGVAPNPNVTAAIGSLVQCTARGLRVNGQLGPAVTAQRRRGDAEYHPPRVIVQATRSGTSVSVDFTIEDPSGAITANPSYKRRDGDDQSLDGSWQTSWNTSTGTAGTDETLVRKVTLADPYTALVWRVQWTDESGNAKETGDELDLASVQQVTKTAVFPSSLFVPEDESTTWSRQFDATEGVTLHPNDSTLTVQRYYAGAVFPDGVTLTDLRARLYEQDSSTDAAEVFLRMNGTALASAAATSSGWSTVSDTMSQVVGSQNFFFDLKLSADANLDAGIAKVEVDYDAPSYKQTY